MVCWLVCWLVILLVMWLDGWSVGSLTVRQWLDGGTLCWMVCWVDGGDSLLDGWIGMGEDSLLEGWIGIVDRSTVTQREVLGTGRHEREGWCVFFFLIDTFDVAMGWLVWAGKSLLTGAWGAFCL
jgi:hypothetical protein